MLKKGEGEKCPILENLLANMKPAGGRGYINETGPMCLNNIFYQA